MKCLVCGKTFEGHHARKTCSDECRKERIKQQCCAASKKYRENRIKQNKILIQREWKICFRCKQEKHLRYFAKDKYNIDGFTYDCKSCRQVVKREKGKTSQYKTTRRKYENAKRVNDVGFRLKKNISSMFWRNLNQNCLLSKKQNRTFEILGYTTLQLKEHLENQFEPWMSWDNYGKAKTGADGKAWNIDHIIPQSKLPYDNLEHPNFRKCWALENLRPLEAFENIRKGNKLLCEKQRCND